MAIQIKKTNKIEFHTSLKDLLFPIIDIIENYEWLLTNQDYLIYDFEEKGEFEQLNFESKKIKFSGKEFLELVKTRNIQFIWGLFCAFKNGVPEILEDDLPYVDGNESIWNNPKDFLIQNSEIEIICFDGTSTLLKFKDKEIENQFLKYFDEAFFLE